MQCRNKRLICWDASIKAHFHYASCGSACSTRNAACAFPLCGMHLFATLHGSANCLIPGSAITKISHYSAFLHNSKQITWTSSRHCIMFTFRVFIYLSIGNCFELNFISNFCQLKLYFLFMYIILFLSSTSKTRIMGKQFNKRK